MGRLVEVDRLLHVAEEEVGALREVLVDLDGVLFGVEVDVRLAVLSYLHVGVSDEHPVFALERARDVHPVGVEAMGARRRGAEERKEWSRRARNERMTRNEGRADEKDAEKMPAKIPAKGVEGEERTRGKFRGPAL